MAIERSDFAADQAFASQCFINAVIPETQTKRGGRKISASLTHNCQMTNGSPADLTTR
jgi:hypothetical protein